MPLSDNHIYVLKLEFVKRICIRIGILYENKVKNEVLYIDGDEEEEEDCYDDGCIDDGDDDDGGNDDDDVIMMMWWG